jgi:hypothetical protein
MSQLTLERGGKQMPRKRPETAGSRLKREVLETYEVTPAERLLLDRAAVLADVCERIDAEVAAAPLTVAGSMGQPVANPLLLQQRKHHEQLQRLLKAVQFPARDEFMGRSAAQARWSRRKAGGA